MAIWYPTKRVPTQIDYGNWSFQASRNAVPEIGRHPFLLISHDTGGSRFSLHQLGIALAKNGFVAVALTHAGDNIDDLSGIFSTRQINGRAEEITRTIDQLAKHPFTEPMLDFQRIGVIGVGPGGAAALLLAGAIPDPAPWADYCAKASLARQASGETDQNRVLLYCTSWASNRMQRMASDPNLLTPHIDTRIKAIALVAPWYGMFFPNLSSVKLPVLLIKAGQDYRNPAVFHVDAIRAALPNDPKYVTIAEADPASLLSPCAPELTQTLPELCLGASEKHRELVQEKLATEITQFFLSLWKNP